MNKWTKDQLLAIESEGNLIVSAAAGAGKTAVLTERIVSRIRAGAPVESLLVLTFTRAAAAEMKLPGLVFTSDMTMGQTMFISGSSKRILASAAGA